MKILKTIEEYTQEKQNEYKALLYGWTGIACPTCKKELLKTGLQYATTPPQMQVKCPDCGYQTLLIA